VISVDGGSFFTILLLGPSSRKYLSFFYFRDLSRVDLGGSYKGLYT